MTVELNHTIIQTHDKPASVRFYTEMFGFKYAGDLGPFYPVEIPGQSFTLDFLDDRDTFERQHYAFKVSDTEFDAIFAKITERGLPYGSEPWLSTDGKTNTFNGGRAVYFRDPSGHLLEILTRDYTPSMFEESPLPADPADWKEPN